MAASLGSPTQQPVQYSTFSFGGDDGQKKLNPIFKGVACWQIDVKKGNAPHWKINAVYGIKKIFAFFDRIGFGTFCFGLGGFTYGVKKTKYFLMSPERNAAAREKIVGALNCRIEDIPVIALPAHQLTDYLKLNDNHFPTGQWLIQGEDPAGRKFLGMRLQDRNGRLHIATIHQRYRETCVMDRMFGGGGCLWVMNFTEDTLDYVPPENFQIGRLDLITDFISQVRQNRHPIVSFSQKP